MRISVRMYRPKLSFVQHLAASFSALILLTACQPAGSDKTSLQTQVTESAKPSISVETVLMKADNVLQNTSDPFAALSGAAELAVAYSSAEKADTAHHLIEQALIQTDSIEDDKKRAAGLLEIITALTDMKATSKASGWLDKIREKSQSLSAQSQANITAKSLMAQAVHDDGRQALTEAMNLPQDEDYEGHFKAVTLRKIANILAKKGDFEAAQTAVQSITMSIRYYQTMVRSDIATLAAKAGNKPLAKTLLTAAEPIARAQDNGYFVGAALRDIGFSYKTMGEYDKAELYFEDALAAAEQADKPNEKARATSRIATRLADAEMFERTAPILKDAISFTQDISSETMQGYSAYEIAGAAAFSANFDLAKTVLSGVPDAPLGSATSMKSAAERDLAWGLARHGQLAAALDVVDTITASREKLQALSRIVRLMNDPKMTALPRYL